MPGARFFPDARLNFAENLLRRNDDTPAIVFHDEAGRQRSLTTAALRHAVEQFARPCGALGIGAGRPRRRLHAEHPRDRSSRRSARRAIGAVWSSCSPDFGVAGRARPLRPDRADACCSPPTATATPARRFDSWHASPRSPRALPSASSGWSSFRTSSDRPALATIPHAVRWDEFLGVRHARRRSSYERLPFDHPLYILYSSGTTGVPKCIVHGAGGTLLQHLKEHQLHCDIRRGDRVFYFTTCGWMMWNWLVSALASERDAAALRRLAVHPRRQRRCSTSRTTSAMTLFGTSREVHRCRRRRPASCRARRIALDSAAHDRSRPARRSRPRASTSSTSASRRDVHLASISGGTDIVGCFVARQPDAARCGAARFSAAALGMEVEVFDDDGQPVRGEKGRARLHGAVSVDADRLLERPGRREVPRRLLRALSRRVAPRRLRRADRARRRGHLRPLRRRR